MKNLTLAALALVSVGTLSASLQANTLELTFSSTGPNGQSMNATYIGGAAGVAKNHNGWVGQLSYEVTGVSGPLANQHFSVGQSVTVFCTDMWQSASGVETYALDDLANAPEPGAYSMGADRAALIAGLYAAHYDDLTSGYTGFSVNETAAAFQLAVWEIAFEDNFDAGAASFATSDLDVVVGFFHSTTDNDARALATIMLENAWNAWQAGQGLELLGGLSDVKQDIILVIPLPAPVWMGLAGLVGVAALRRRKLA